MLAQGLHRRHPPSKAAGVSPSWGLCRGLLVKPCTHRRVVVSKVIHPGVPSRIPSRIHGCPSPAPLAISCLCPALTGRVWSELSLWKWILCVHENYPFTSRISLKASVSSTWLVTGCPHLSVPSFCFYEQIVVRGSWRAIGQKAALPFKPHYVKIKISFLLANNLLLFLSF